MTEQRFEFLFVGAIALPIGANLALLRFSNPEAPIWFTPFGCFLFACGLILLKIYSDKDD